MGGSMFLKEKSWRDIIKLLRSKICSSHKRSENSIHIWIQFLDKSFKFFSILCLFVKLENWIKPVFFYTASQAALMVKDPPASAGDTRASGSIPGWRRSPGGWNGTHSSIPAWKIPWTKEPGGLQSMGSQSQTWLSTDTHGVFKTVAHTPPIRSHDVNLACLSRQIFLQN